MVNKHDGSPLEHKSGGGNDDLSIPEEIAVFVVSSLEDPGDSIETLPEQELLEIKQELDKFKGTAREIYNKYFSKLKIDEQAETEANGFCTIADEKIESSFRKFVKSSEVLKGYVVVGEEQGVEEGGQDGKKVIMIDPIDSTDLFVKGENGSGTIIGVFHNGINIVGTTLDIGNGLDYTHWGNEYTVKHNGETIKSKLRFSPESSSEPIYREFEDESSFWIKEGRNRRNKLHLYNSCKGKNWDKGDAEKMEEITQKLAQENGLEVVLRKPRSVSYLNSALGLNGGFIHYGTAAHDIAHMIGFTNACDGIITDHNGIKLEKLDLEKILKNYQIGEKMKKEAKKLRRESKEENDDSKIKKAKQLEMEARDYIYTFPFVITRDQEFHDEIISLLKEFKPQLDAMQENN